MIMPNGAISEDLLNCITIEKYIATHAKHWYEYATSDECGRRMKNGDLRVVVGCDKVSSWGIATFATAVAQRVHLEFKGIDHETPASRNYMWDCLGTVNGRVGPDDDEIQGLSQETGTPLKNQCVFLRTISLALSEKFWNELAVHQVRSSNLMYSLPDLASPPAAGESDISQVNITYSTKLGLPVSHDSILCLGAQDVEFCQVLHPSMSLNEILLKKVRIHPTSTTSFFKLFRSTISIQTQIW